MGEAAHAGVEPGAELRITAGGVAGSDDRATRDQGARWHRRRHLLRRQRDQGDAVVERSRERDLVVVRHAELAGVVRPLARRREVRAFEVDAEHARHALRDRLAHRRDRCAHDLDVVADQRRQEPGGAEAPMRGADAADRVDRRRVVEQHAAAAVDLGVDETGQQRVRRADRACRHRAGAGRRRARPRRCARLSTSTARPARSPSSVSTRPLTSAIVIKRSR